MNRHRVALVSLATGAALTVLPAASHAAGELLPFWGQPYPYRYAYVDQKDSCYRWERVETRNGPRRAYVWECENVVKSRY